MDLNVDSRNRKLFKGSFQTLIVKWKFNKSLNLNESSQLC